MFLSRDELQEPRSCPAAVGKKKSENIDFDAVFVNLFLLFPVKKTATHLMTLEDADHGCSQQRFPWSAGRSHTGLGAAFVLQSLSNQPGVR